MKLLFVISDSDDAYRHYQNTGSLRAPHKRSVEIELTAEQIKKIGLKRLYTSVGVHTPDMKDLSVYETIESVSILKEKPPFKPFKVAKPTSDIPWRIEDNKGMIIDKKGNKFGTLAFMFPRSDFMIYDTFDIPQPIPLGSALESITRDKEHIIVIVSFANYSPVGMYKIKRTKGISKVEGVKFGAHKYTLILKR